MKNIRIATYVKAALLAVLVLAVIGIALIRTSAAVQDRLIKRGINAALANAQSDLGGDYLDVIFCGTASPMGGAGPRGTAQACVAVLAGDKFFLVDTGARSADKAVVLGLPMQRLSGVFLTHFHSDHIAALGEMHLASWVRGRASKLDVYGGPGVKQVVDGFNLAYGQDYGYRTGHHGEDYVPSSKAGLVAKPIQADRVVYDEDGLKITAITVSHPPIEPALAFRFDYKGRSVLISGDTKKDGNLIAAAKNVDVLIHEVIQRDMVDIFVDTLGANGQARLGKIIKDTHDYHASPVEAAQSANAANADLLVFYHYAPVPQNALMDRIFMRGVDAIRADNVLAARDGTHIRLPIKSDIISIEK
jgi:ribonuclease Z